MDLQTVIDEIKNWDNILVLSHASPDGDTIGSAAAMVYAFQKMGKKVKFDCADDLPKKFEYMFTNIEKQDFKEDKIIAVDIAAPVMLGGIKEKYLGKIDLAIDHHLGHTNLAEMEFVDSNCAANTEIIYKVIDGMGVDIDENIADCIYTGLSTDTGCFRYRNVTAYTHEIAAKVILAGAKAADINKLMFETKTKGQLNSEIACLSSIEYYLNGELAILSVTRSMMNELGISEQDIDILVSRPREIEGVIVGATLKEKPEGGFKVSVRTNSPANASDICSRMGGGGHKGAAGCLISGDLDSAKQRIVSTVEAYFKENSL